MGRNKSPGLDCLLREKVLLVSMAVCDWMGKSSEFDDKFLKLCQTLMFSLSFLSTNRSAATKVTVAADMSFKHIREIDCTLYF